MLSITAAEAETDKLVFYKVEVHNSIILTCVELNDSLGCVRVRVGDGGQFRVLIYRIVNLKQEEN